MPTFLDLAINNFFQASGGLDFLKLIFTIPIIVFIMSAIIKPFNI